MQKLKIFALFAAVSLVFSGCSSKIRLNEKELRLSLGQEKTLTVTKGKDVQFSSSDPSIAAVDEKGTVTALGNGIAVISAFNDKAYVNTPVIVGNGVAEYIDENGNKTTALVPLAADEGLLSGESNITAIKLSIKGGGTEDVSISADKSYELVIEKTPSDSIDKITLKIADSSIARVDGKTLKGVSRGKTLLTATAPNGVSTEMIVRVK